MPLDVVVPVPLHQSRRKERGYDQAELLANSLAEHSGLPLGSGWLVRQRPTVPQVRTASAMERRSNVRGAFTSGPRVERARAVLLVDDVCTTGATLESCALALQEAGVRQVWGLTVAREP
ncbi:MAG: phosphoribosyltransferase family protein [Dehalococcoidia bacterium]|nr:phosphoribosyltransferase family protein [Dehalococcoidia bacterium]